jgi:hypothetical protein
MGTAREFPVMSNSLRRAVERARGLHPRSRGVKALASVLGVALVATGLTVATTAAPALADGAGQPFSCTSPTFFAQAGDATTTQLYTGTYATATGQGTWTPLGADNTTTANNYNALALNPVDKYLYGVVISGAIVRIDSAGVTTTIGNTSPALGTAPKTLWDTGAFDPSGNYYVGDGNGGTTTIYKITNLSGTPTATPITLPASISFADLTWKDGYLWGHSYNSGTNFYRIDVSTSPASVVTIDSAIIPAGTYGADYTITNGNLSFISNSMQYQVAVANPTSAAPTLSLVNSVAAPTNARADATNCLDVANADLRISKTGPANVALGASITWTVTVHNNGPGDSSGWAMQDNLPAAVTGVTATSSSATCVVEAPVVTCSGGTLASGSNALITVMATAPTTASMITNSASILGYEADPNASNSSSAVTTAVGDQPLALTDDAAFAPYETHVNVNVLANDTFTNGGVTAVSSAGHGTTTTEANGTVGYTPDAGYTGADTFTYTVTDGSGQTSTATVTMTVGPKPLAVDDDVTVAAGSAVNVDVLANDIGSNLTVTNTTDGTHGTVTIANGKPVYNSSGSYSGTDSFTYAISDTVGNTSTAVVTVTVTPTAIDDSSPAVAGVPTSVDVVPNDLGSNLVVTATTDGSHGTVAIVGGEPQYTSAGTFSGIDTFTYTVSDALNNESEATVVMSVRPKAVDDAATVAAGSSASVPVVVNDLGTGLSVTAVTDGSHGTVTIANGKPVYTPSGTYSGSDTFTYTVTDGSGHTSTAAVVITVRPVANPDSVSSIEGDVVPVDVLPNDIGTGIHVTSATDGAHGTVAIVGARPVYTPATGYVGSDTFTYTIVDTAGNSSVGTVTVTMGAGPSAADDTAIIVAGDSASIDVLANDTGTGLSVTGATNGGHGTVAIVAGQPVYSPATGFSGTDTFTYTGKDAGNHPISATVTVTVTPKAVSDVATVVNSASVSVDVVQNDLGTGNVVTDTTDGAHGTVAIVGGKPVYTSTGTFSGTDAFSYTITDAALHTDTSTVTVTVLPRAVADAVTVVNGSSVTANVLVNDAGVGLSVTGSTDGSHGAVAIVSGKPVYTSTGNFSGTDVFTYTITDAAGNSSTASVTVTVTPHAVDDRATSEIGDPVAIAVLGNDRGTGLQLSTPTDGAHGTVAISSGKLVYTPAPGYTGADSFIYGVVDALGNTSSATVSVTVTPGPTATDDTATVSAGSAVSVDVLANDTGTGLAVTGASDGSHGTVSIVAGKPVYQSTGSYSGPDTFTYTGEDAASHPVSATVTVTVTPVAKDDFASTVAETPVTVSTALGNDLGSALTVSTTTDGSHGTVSIAAGRPVYDPALNFSGADSFTYTVTDSSNQLATATVYVTVSPSAGDDLATTPAGTPKSVAVSANDRGTGISVTSTTDGAHGTVAIVSGKPVFTPTTNFSGIDTFTYTITDAAGGMATATVTVTVVPVAQLDTDSTITGDALTVPVLANDLGTGIYVSSVTNGAHGTVAIVGGKPVYTPAVGYVGPDSFSYTITDAALNSSSASVTVNVTSGPSATNDDASVIDGSSVSVDVLANDSGTGLTVTSTTNGTHGTVVIVAGQPIYTPALHFSGTDTFSYAGEDSTDHPISATVTITVTPAAQDDVATVISGSSVSVAVFANDLGTALTVTGKTNGTNGSVSTGSGTPVYTPAADFSGSDSFTYTITDGSGRSDTATVTVSVLPLAVDDSATTPVNVPLTLPVIPNDHGSGLTISQIGDGAHGTVTLVAGELVYQPATDFSGIDSFYYSVTDSSHHVSTATATVSVTPTAANDTVTTIANTAVSVDALPNDRGSSLVVSATSNGSHGSVSIVSGEPEYVPAPDFSGVDTFTYTARDAASQSVAASVTVTVSPVAVDDSGVTDVEVPVTIAVLANDAGSALTISGSTNGAHGTVSVSAANTVTFHPAPGYSGTDTFSYTATDGTTPVTANVRVSVTPLAQADSATTVAGTAVALPSMANDAGTALQITGKTNGTHGTVVILPGNVVRFTPVAGFSGTDTFTYTVTDASNLTATAIDTVTVTPTAVSDATSTPINTPVTIDVLSNDLGSSLVVGTVGGTSHGTVTVVGVKTRYTPDAGYSGRDAFTYSATDSSGQATSATVSILVLPVAPNDAATTPANTPITVDVLANDSGTGLTITAVTQPAHGTVTITGGKVQYVPNAGYSGVDPFGYTSKDSSNTPATAIVTIDVTPIVVNNVSSGPAGRPITLNPSTNDTGTSLIVTGMTTPANGTIVLNPDGTVTYTPDSGFSGTDRVTYTTTDPSGQTGTATITLTIRPTAHPDHGTTIAAEPISIRTLRNDDGTALHVTSHTDPKHGRVTIDSKGVARYTPSEGFVGTDTFSYTATDASGQSATTLVTIVVTAGSLGSNGLAFTGTDPGPIGLGALLLLLLGALAMYFGRRRREGPRHSL